MRFVDPPATKTSRFVQASLYVLLLAVFLLSGVFEVLGNLSGERTDNVDSSAPLIAKVGKELVLMLIVAVVLVPRWRRVRVDSLSVAALSIVMILALPSAFFLRGTISAEFGFVYLFASLLMCVLFALATPYIRTEQFYRWFLVPAVLIVLFTQFVEIKYAPSSFYNETGLFGLDRRAGIAVIPTTAGCLAALCSARARGLMFIVTLMVLGIANSTLAWCAAFLIWTARIRNAGLLLVAAPILLAALVALVLSRPGLMLSADTRIGLLTESLNDLQAWTPSLIGAGATAKAVALSRADSFIADSTPLEFMHVFGVIPGLLIFVSVVALFGRIAGWRAAAFFFGVSIGFLFTESWILTSTLMWMVSRLGFPRPVARPQAAPLAAPDAGGGATAGATAAVGP
jgi:hypothetical protein